MISSLKNYNSFSEVCDHSFGRKIINTNAKELNAKNICLELSKALSIHLSNQREIDYLDRYYRGDQPILYRNKEIRPEVNNKIVENLAFAAVERHTAEIAGEPIQYVLYKSDETKSEEVARLNKIIADEDKNYYDIELCRWRSICGTAYRYVYQSNDGSYFHYSVENPRDTFVAYFKNGRPAFSCQIMEDENNSTYYQVYTDRFYFKIQDGKVIDTKINGYFAIPVVEYPNNSRRLSDIEITISITDEISRMASDRSNGIEQFVSSWIKFVNCEIDIDTYRAMRQEGALVVKSNNGTDNKADVDVMTSELNQTESQVAVSDLYEKFLIIQGFANREGNTGGDTQGAVLARNGWYEQEKRSELSEPIFVRAERNSLRVVLRILKLNHGFSLETEDIAIKISRTKMDNLYTKAEALKMLLDCGVDYARAIKTIGIWSDPEQVAVESKARMEILYPTEIIADENGRTEQTPKKQENEG